MIRNLVNVDDASPATAPKIFPDGAPSIARARIGGFPEEEGMM